MAVIQTDQLVKYYGADRGLDGLDMVVESGEIYGFLGPNGAGKSTTIRLLLDVIRPTSGSMSVFGLDPRRQGVELRRRIGYLPGDLLLEGRQTARQLIDHLADLRGDRYEATVSDLADRLDLDLGRPIMSLSKGNRQKVGLMQAFMHSPELLVLDEPTSGLDPLIQREVHGMVAEAKAEGRTVFMSSHVLSEVQSVVERVGIIRDGRMVAVERVEDLKERAVRAVEVIFEYPVTPGDFAAVPGVSDVIVDGTTLSCRLSGRADDFLKVIAGHAVISITAEEPDLEEVFFDFYTKEPVTA